MTDTDKTPPIQNTSGDHISGDKFGGDYVAGNKVMGDEITNHFYQSLTDEKARQNYLRNRQNILNNVHATWIEGYLHHAVHQQIFLTLGLEQQHDVLSRPWNLAYQPTSKAIPADKSIHAIFESDGRSLLILGEPGSGKTITLLQLADQLITIAQADNNQPIPIILNLSSWAQTRQPLTDWLVEQLFLTYQVARPLSRDWLAANQFTLLLDGLDEVDPTYRNECITAINTFKADHPIDIAICSRTADYKALNQQLNLSAAIEIQPLGPDQINTYLSRDDLELQTVKDTLQRDPALQELTTTPLMLSLITLAYRGLTPAQLQPLDSPAARRHHLYITYIQCMFQHHPLPPDASYDQPQALQWLTNLAYQLNQHNQTIFYIENLQPSWLPTPGDRMQHLLTRLTFGKSEPFKERIVFHEIIYWEPPSLQDFWRSLITRLRTHVVIAVVGGLLIWLVFGLYTTRYSGLFLGLYVALIGALFFLLAAGAIELLYLSIQTRQTQQRKIPNQGVGSSVRNALRMFLVFGIVFWLINGLIFGLFGGLTSWMFSKQLNELINGLIAGLFVGLFIGLIFGLLIGVAVGIVKFGGLAVIQHYTTRFLLTRQDILPFPFSDRKLIAYLDSMSDRTLLRRVGGGWVFIHRTLLEYFAAQHPDYSPEET